MDEREYIVLSLELHLFFSRIMKEHSLFLEAGFTPQNARFSKVADQYKKQFEFILYTAVQLGNGVVSEGALSSGEFVTDYTLGSEQKTQQFTSIPINQQITKLESKMQSSHNPRVTKELFQQVKKLNKDTEKLVSGLIQFKKNVLEEVLSCHMFTANYPLLIEHIIHEANMYKGHLATLEGGQQIDTNIKETELFWDHIMMEHALFIRGLLDPTENDLIKAANSFVKDYDNLIQEALVATDRTIASVTNDTLKETIKYRNFKQEGTIGINECKIRSIILPLLADHVLRESNHYIRLLTQFQSSK